LPLKGLTTADVIKAGREAIDRALEALDKMERYDDEHIPVPWEILERPKLDPEIWSGSEVKAVEIKSLYASQRLLTIERVRFYIEHPGAIEAERRAFANVYAMGDQMIIVDGHHRLAAFWLLGAELANVWFLED